MSFESREDLDNLLRTIDAEKASDLHLGPGRTPIMRKHGKLMEVPGYFQNLTEHDMEIIVEISYRSAVGPSAVMSMEDLDYSYELAASNHIGNSEVPARYRVNSSGSMLGIRTTFRRLPAEPPELSKINVPEICTELVRSMDRGIILVTGPTGSGKTTTLAGWMRYLLELDSSLHIITLENPIEFRYDSLNLKSSYVTQRELRKNMADFKTGMKSVLRQDPDIVMIGEMRDTETIRLAMEVADTGHLVLSTTHTSDVPSTISRIVQMYPADEQQAVRIQLISALRMIVCQQLLPSVSGGRCAAREYLIFTPEMRRSLMSAPPETMNSMLQDLTKTKGVSMGESVRELYENGLISAENYAEKMAALQEDAGVVADADQKAKEEAAMSKDALEAKRKLFQEKMRTAKPGQQTFADKFPADHVKRKKREKTNESSPAMPTPIVPEIKKHVQLDEPPAPPVTESFSSEVLESRNNIQYVSPIQHETQEQSSTNTTEAGGLLDLVPDDNEVDIDFSNPVLQDGGKVASFEKTTTESKYIEPVIAAMEPTDQHPVDMPVVEDKKHAGKALALNDPGRYWSDDMSDWERWQQEAQPTTQIIENALDTPVPQQVDENINIDAIAWAMGLSSEDVEKKIRDHGLSGIRDAKALQEALTAAGKKKGVKNVR